jgi:hypothetical protein
LRTSGLIFIVPLSSLAVRRPVEAGGPRPVAMTAAAVVARVAGGGLAVALAAAVPVLQERGSRVCSSTRRTRTNIRPRGRTWR